LAVGCIFFAVIVVYVMVSSSSASSKPLSDAKIRGITSSTQSRSYDWLLRNGVVGQGILLQVDNTKTRDNNSSPSLRLERRSVRIDVEVPGQPSYELQTSPSIPTHLSGDILPGATVELRVDPGDPTQLMVYGPGVGLPGSLFAATMPEPPAPPPDPSPQLPVDGSLGAPEPKVDTTGARRFCRSCGANVDPQQAIEAGVCPVCGADWL
jgi:hypothetical protein